MAGGAAGGVTAHQRRVLRVVLAINVAMFFIEFLGGLVGRSTALLADSVDMLGYSIVYGFSLYVLWVAAPCGRRAARC
jgi:Co/Zn/Cd efflux system component